MSGSFILIWVIGAIALVPAALIAIPLHEMGHAFAAYRLGDNSVRAFGYLRPQVRRFIDPYGALAVLLANVGWGRPAPIQRGRIGWSGGRPALYFLAGPLANIGAAIVFGILLRVMEAAGIYAGITPAEPVRLLGLLVLAIFFLNLSIAAFQLLPIPGLDGWELLAALVRRRNPAFFMRVEQNRQTVWIIAAALIFFGPTFLHFNPLNAVVGIVFEPISIAVLGRCATYISLQPCPI